MNMQHPVNIQQYLRELRQQYRDSVIGKNQFILSAADAYCDERLILRALSLITLLDTGAMTKEQSCHLHTLKGKIFDTGPLPYKLCSLNMIVKNEQRTITEALDSVDTILDEIVICDTGSTDRTVDEAALYGVRLIHDPWQNDFSRARNKAIEASTCDWIFWMDADDILDEKSSAPLRQLWRTGAAQGAAFCIVNIRDQAPAVSCLQVRLFPRGEGIIFQQRIHEQIMFAIASHNIPFTSIPQIRIIHTGYKNPQIHFQKAQRNKMLLQNEVFDKPDDPTLRLCLGDCLCVLKEHDRALAEYLSVTGNQQAWHINKDVFVQAHINCGKIFYRKKDYDNAKRYYYRSLYLDDSRIESYYALGRIFLHESRERKAAEFFMKSALINPPLRLTASDNLMVKLESIYYLMDLLIRWRRYSEAENILHASISCYPSVPQFYNQLAGILLTQGNITQAARQYTMSIKISPDSNSDAYEGMARIYTMLGDRQTADRYLLHTTASSHQTSPV